MGPIQRKTLSAVEAIITLGFSKLEEEREGHVLVSIEDLRIVTEPYRYRVDVLSAATDRILEVINGTGNGSDTATD